LAGIQINPKYARRKIEMINQNKEIKPLEI